MPEPNYITFAGPVAIPLPDFLDGSVRAVEFGDVVPLPGYVAWQLAPAMYEIFLEVCDSRSFDPQAASVEQRTIIGLGNSISAPGRRGQSPFPISCGPLITADTGYPRYVVTLTTKLKWRDIDGHPFEVAGIAACIFNVTDEKTCNPYGKSVDSEM